MRRHLGWLSLFLFLAGCSDSGSVVVSDDCHASCDNDVACGVDRDQCLTDCDDIAFVAIEVGCGDTARDYFACAARTTACGGERDATCASFADAYEDCICSAVQCAS